MSESKEEKKVVGPLFNIISDVGAGFQFQITGNLPVDANEATVRKEFVKYRKALETQRTMSLVPRLEEDLAQARSTLKLTRQQVAKLDARVAGKQIPSAEKANREQLVSALEAEELLVAHKTEVLEKAKKELDADLVE